jgi:hypothetical protein
MEKVSKVIGPINVTMREVLGRALKRARIDRLQVNQQIDRTRAALRSEEQELLRLEDIIIDLTDALGDEEAARWEA